MMLQILADLHVLEGSIPLGPSVAVLRVPLQPSDEATDDDKAGLPGNVLGARHGTWLWQWVRLLMRKLQGLVDVRVLLLLMRMLRILVDVTVLLGTPQWT